LIDNEVNAMSTTFKARSNQVSNERNKQINKQQARILTTK
jgi:hypothetical protein